MWTQFYDITKPGIVTDLQSHALPVGAWTDGVNIEFEPTRIVRAAAEKSIYDSDAHDYNLDRPMIWGTNVVDGINSYWICSTDQGELIIIDDSGLTKITTGRALTYNYRWNGGLFSGYLILNSGSGKPQTWRAVKKNAVADLPNWPDGLVAGILKPFGYFLVAAHLEDSSGTYENRIRWSSSAAPGMLPSSWSLTDASVDSGQFDLNDDSPGGIIDMVELRDWLIVYKRNSIWAMRYVGGGAIFATTQLFEGQGALSTNCVASFSYKGGQFHCVLTGDDVIIHDGRSVVKRLENRVAKRMRQEFNSALWQKAYVVNNAEKYENWIVYPVQDESTYFDKAIIWNYNEDSVSFQYLPIWMNWMASGIVVESGSGDTWNSGGNYDWDTIAKPWITATETNFRNKRLLGINSYGMYIVNGDDASYHECFLEKTNIAVVPNRETKQPMLDFESWKLLKGVRVQMNNGPVVVTISARDYIEDFRVRQKRFVVLSDSTKLDVILSGRCFDIRFEMNEAHRSRWELYSFELDIEKIGDY